MAPFLKIPINNCWLTVIHLLFLSDFVKKCSWWVRTAHFKGKCFQETYGSRHSLLLFRRILLDLFSFLPVILDFEDISLNCQELPASFFWSACFHISTKFPLSFWASCARFALVIIVNIIFFVFSFCPFTVQCKISLFKKVWFSLLYLSFKIFVFWK